MLTQREHTIKVWISGFSIYSRSPKRVFVGMVIERRRLHVRDVGLEAWMTKDIPPRHFSRGSLEVSRLIP